jgi:cyanophycinase
MSPAVVADQNGRGGLMAIGGGEDKIKERRILSHFFGLAGSQQARIAVIPAASTQPDQAGALYQAIFQEMGAAEVEVFHIRSRADAQDAGRVAALQQMSAIFLSGGNQLRLLSLLGGTAMAQAIRRLNARGVVVAGTSAGASALSQHMIAFGRAGEWPSQRMVQLTPGLGLTNRVVIDQHFQNRGRTGRLLIAVAYNPFIIGLGIDEDTAVVLDPQNRLRIIGRSSVVIVDGGELGYTDVGDVQRHGAVTMTNIRLHVLTDSFGYDLIGRQVALPEMMNDE